MNVIDVPLPTISEDSSGVLRMYKNYVWGKEQLILQEIYVPRKHMTIDSSTTNTSTNTISMI